MARFPVAMGCHGSLICPRTGPINGACFRAYVQQVLVPTLQFPPAIVQGGLLRLRGVFPLRPNAVGFDLLFQNVNGQWKVFGISVVPLVLQSQQSGAIRH